LILAAPSRIGYTVDVVQRAVALFALLSVVAAPAVTSTRAFCRYTGEEVVGCAEVDAPEQAQIRGDRCCVQRTFHAVEGVRVVERQDQPAAAPAAIDAAAFIAVLAVGSPGLRITAAPPIGPPAFLSHRALLI
jgi:hypothetical protein